MAAKRKAKSSGRSGKTAPRPLPSKELRWRCPPSSIPYASTDEIEPLQSVVGQDAAIEALRFGLTTTAPGQNIFVRGLTGTGRFTLVRRMLDQLKPRCATLQDRCYVHNFAQPDRPRLISLPPGHARRLQRRVDGLLQFIEKDLPTLLTSDQLEERRKGLERGAEKKLAEVVEPFEAALAQAGLGLVTLRLEKLVQKAIFPLVNGKPISPEEFEQLHTEGQIPDDQYASVSASASEYEQKLGEIQSRANELREEYDGVLRELIHKTARTALSQVGARITGEFPQLSVQIFLNELIEEIVARRLGQLGDEAQISQRYRVQVVLEHEKDGACPIVVETTPSLRQLLGGIDFEYGPGEEVRASHGGIRAGSLLRADGGYLIMEARDLVTEDGAWKLLIRTLRTGRLEIVPPEFSGPWSGPSIKPEAIDIDVKVILLGDTQVFYGLDQIDPDFSELFKVLADFDHVIPRTKNGIHQYASVLGTIARQEDLPPFARSAISALVEHGARIASNQDKLTARFGRLADVAREAAHVAGERGGNRVVAKDVHAAVASGKRRADLPSRRFREMVSNGTIRIQTQGQEVGQVTGLAVLGAGPIMYGFPARITATIGPGSAGVINIERESALSGAIHTKGFYILGGLLRTLLRTEHPLAFAASVAFEQSYGGIDGDSASGAEICCLLSALTEIPLRQDIAMTGAIDQMGNILAIGAVNEKIEGYFDACHDLGAPKGGGVIIPRANAAELMLREDLVSACAKRRFHVYAVDTIHEAIEIFTGMPAGVRDSSGSYASGTVLAIAMERAREYWRKASPPRALASEAD